MKSPIRAVIAVLTAVMLTVACAGCGQSDGTTRVRVCEVTHSIFYAPQYVAIEKGFFRDEGLDIELSNGQGADAVMAAVLSDNIDIGFAGPEAAIYVYNEGQEDYPQVFGQVTRRDGSFLLAREADADFSWSKLKGKTVLPGRKGGVPYMTFEHVLRENGLDPATDLVMDNSVQYAMMTAAFTGGTGDYVTAFEPTASLMQEQKQGFIVASVGEASGDIPYTAYFAKGSYLTDHADVITRFTRALYRGQQWVASHTAAEIAEAVAASFPDTTADLLTKAVDSYRRIGAWNETPVMTAESFDRLQLVMTEAGELSEKADFDRVVNNSFAEAVVAGN